MTQYPLLFTFKELVSGNGFLAGVLVHGRGLLVNEGEGGWWLYGVVPGGMAETGDTAAEAHARFRQGSKSVLFDVAAEAASYEDFANEVLRCLDTCDDEEQRRWTAAVEAIRAGAPVEDTFTSLPRQPADGPTGVQVVRLDAEQQTFGASDNVMDQYALPEAA